MSTKQEVPPKEIEAKLVEIWDDLQGTNKMRACLFNLIIFTKKNSRLGYLETISQKLIEKFPTRIIFITLDDKASGDVLKTEVSVMSAKAGENEIVCDLINVEVSESNKKIIPFIAIPHLLPDLPVYLHWADDPRGDNPILETLGKYATRIIYDSECCDHIGSFASAVLSRKNDLDNNFADLNWRRMEGWRHLLADTFADPSFQNVLHTAKSIAISFNEKASESFAHNRTQALYLQAWIASQLEWKFEKAEENELHYTTPHGAMSFTLNPEETSDKVGPGRLTSITVVSQKEEKIVCQRKQDNPCTVRIEMSTPDHCNIPTDFLLESYALGVGLAKELGHKGTSRHLTKLLELLATCKEEALHT